MAWRANLVEEDKSDARNAPEAIQMKLTEEDLRNVKEHVLDSFPLEPEHKKYLPSVDLAEKWQNAKAIVKANKESGNKQANVGRKAKGPVFKDLDSIFKNELDDALAVTRAQKLAKQTNRKKDPMAQQSPLVLGMVNDIGKQVTPLDANLPPSLGFIIGPMPQTAMKDLVMEYGSVPAMKRFQDHADAISSSQFDGSYCEYKKAPREELDDAMRVARKNKLNEEAMKNGLHAYPGMPTKTDLEAVSKWKLDATDTPCEPPCGKLSKKLIGNMKGWYEALGLNEPWYVEKHQTRYLMDITGLTADDEPNNGEPNKEVTAEDAWRAGLYSNDSKYMSDNGSEAVVQVRSVVNAALNHVLGTASEDKDWICHSGAIQSGASCINQDLHIDSKDILDNAYAGHMKALKGMWKDGDTKQAKELVQSYQAAGYVVDIPLSCEGSWLRIAIPDQANKTFTMKWVYVPFGRALVRSMLLFHGGHYGSPGNTRFHCTMTFGGELVGEKELGYIQFLAKDKTKRTFQDWKLQWAPTASNCPYYQPEFNKANVVGTKYFKRFLMRQAKLGRGCLLIALTNLNTHCLTRGPLLGAQEEEEENGDQDRKPKARSRKRKQDTA